MAEVETTPMLDRGCRDGEDTTGIGKKKYKTKLIIFIVVLTIALIAVIIIALELGLKRKASLFVKSSVVKTDCGLIKGFKETLGGTSAYVFKGIPYAKPPVKNLRWKPSQSLKSAGQCWQGVLNADQFKSSCPQLDFAAGLQMKGHEDCLYLNVWTPTSNKFAKLPVMVWIHGGYLNIGDGNQLGYSPNVEFVTTLNIVAVSFNYRLNAFGFMALDALSRNSSTKTSGNYGFMDQILAFKWVKNNIMNFGGDPSKITIVGQSSGGTSIFGLLASKEANGLFKGAIAMSGSPIFNKTTAQASQDNIIFLKKANCAKNTTRETIDCLYSLNQSQILHSIPWYEYPYWAMTDLTDLPTKNHFDGAVCVVDGDVVFTPPAQLNNYPPMANKVALMIGSTAQEIDFLPVKDFRNKNFSDFMTFAKSRLDPFSKGLADEAINLYNRTLNSSLPQLFYTTMATDIRVSCPTNVLSRNLSDVKNLDVYRYEVTNRPSKAALWFGTHTSKYSAHMWDSSALFEFHGMPIRYKPGKRDLLFSKTIRNEFLHFFKTGKPMAKAWKTYPWQIGIFGDERLTIKRYYHHEQCQLWNKHNFFPYGWIN